VIRGRKEEEESGRKTMKGGEEEEKGRRRDSRRGERRRRTGRGGNAHERREGRNGDDLNGIGLFCGERGRETSGSHKVWAFRQSGRRSRGLKTGGLGLGLRGRRREHGVHRGG